MATRKKPVRRVRRMSRQQILEVSQRWLDIIGARKRLRMDQRRKIARETVRNFDGYYNKGFLEYRKSITEAGEYAAIEWEGQGVYFTDVLGRKYLDCLGGFGIYSAGIRHPKIVSAVASQLERMPLSSQE